MLSWHLIETPILGPGRPMFTMVRDRLDVDPEFAPKAGAARSEHA
jgi:hypothetical protein